MNHQNNPNISGNHLNDGQEKKKGKKEIKVIKYNDENFIEEDLTHCPPLKDDETTWIRITNFSSKEQLQNLLDCFRINSHLIKKIMNFDYIPDVNDYKNYLYVNLTAFYANNDSTVNPVEISIILGKNYVISLHQDDATLFNKIMNNLKVQDHQIRRKGADYLAYSIIDIILDNHILKLKEMENRLSKETEKIMDHPKQDTSRIIHSYRQELDKIRNYALPLQQIVNSMEMTESSLIHQSTETFLENFKSHVEQVIHRIDTLSNRINELREVYNSSMSLRLDEIVRVLTVVTVIFAPGTFIVGVYGMNFKFMPELEIPHSYPIVLFLNFVIAIGMLLYFRKRGWI